MNWQWTPYLIPLFVAVGVLLAAALYLSWREQVAPGRGAVVIFMLANAGWATGYIFEVGALDLGVKKTWAALQFIFIVFGVVSLFGYTVQYTGREGWLTRRRLLWLTLPLLVITALPFSVQTEALFWREFSLSPVGGLILFKYEFGPALSIYYGAVYLLLLVTVIWLAEMYFRSRNLYRAQTLLLLLSVFVPWLGSAIDLLKIIPIELGVLSTSVTALCVGWSLVRFRLGEVIPVARETIIEAMHDGVIVLDPDHRIVDVNPTARHLLESEMLGQPIDQLWPQWPVLLETALGQAGRGGEMRFDHSDGRHIYDVHISSLLDWRDRLVSRVVVLRDITDRKQAEAALRENEELLRATFEQAAMGIAHVALDGRWLRVNQRLCDIVGYSAEALGTLTFQQITHPADLAPNLVLLEQLIAGDIQNYSIEKRYIHQNGSPVWVQVTTSLVRDEAGRPKYFIAVIEDIAERKQAEKIVQKYAAELERSNRELEQFAYSASHDLQEPLRKIQTFGGRLEAKYGEALGEQGRDYLSRMNNATVRMQALIDGLLAFSRITTQAQPFALVNLAEVLSEVLDDLAARLEQSGGQVTVVGDLPSLEADPVQMRQLLQNLLSNALKFHAEAVPPLVTVRAWPASVEGDSLIPMCRLTVEDNGIGFEQKDSEQIFQVFHRLHGRSQYEGTGIGLATCRKIVERHGGTITAHSAPGVGTTFIITLPQHQPIGDNNTE